MSECAITRAGRMPQRAAIAVEQRLERRHLRLGERREAVERPGVGELDADRARVDVARRSPRRRRRRARPAPPRRPAATPGRPRRSASARKPRHAGSRSRASAASALAMRGVVQDDEIGRRAAASRSEVRARRLDRPQVRAQSAQLPVRRRIPGAGEAVAVGVEVARIVARPARPRGTRAAPRRPRRSGRRRRRAEPAPARVDPLADGVVRLLRVERDVDPGLLRAAPSRAER